VNAFSTFTSPVRRLVERLRWRDDTHGHAPLRVRLALFGALVILAFATSTAYDAWRSYRNAVASTDRELENLASVLAEQTAWTSEGVDLALLDVARWLRCMQYGIDCQFRTSDAGANLTPGHTDGFLASAAARVPQVYSIRVLDAHGILRNSSDPRAQRGLDVSYRSFFLAQKHNRAQGLFISEPLVTRSEGHTAVILSRRLEDNQGRFAGVVGAEIDLQELHRLYAAVSPRGRIAVQLLREDGTLLARSPSTPALVGRTFPSLATLAPGVATRMVSPLDRDREFVAVARVHSAPLLIAASRSETAALAAAKQEALHGGLRTLLLAALAAFTIAVLLRQLSRTEEVAAALRQSQKMEAMGTLAGGIAHDFNNILGAIVGYGELAQEQAPEGGALRRYLDNIMRAAARARALVDRILGFSRGGLAEQVPIAIGRVVTETLELLQASLPSSIRLERELLVPVDVAVIGDETRLHQVTMNLCTNAAQAMPDGGVLRVRLEELQLIAPRTLSRGPVAAGAYVRLTVSDNGTGIPPALVERIFDPFFTTKRVGEGTGLGLAMVDGIVRDLGGAIHVSSVMGSGTTFEIWLPVTPEPAAALVTKTGELPRGRGECVMIVDDEQPLVELVEEMLAELGYEPVGFSSGSAALEAFRKNPDRFDVVVTDEMMLDLRGTELARSVSAVRPDVALILMSGHGGPELAQRVAAAGVGVLLRKPLQKRDLAESMRKVLRTARPV
jgi:signal transduction histidine kinase/CheY-like chemotaxis protein